MLATACGESYVDDSDRPPGNGLSIDANSRIAPEMRDRAPWNDGWFTLLALMSVDKEPIQSVACSEKLIAGQDFRGESARSFWNGASDAGLVSGGSSFGGLADTSTVPIYGAAVPSEDDITAPGRRVVAGFVDLEVTSDACRFAGDEPDRSPPRCMVSRFECAVGSCLSLLVWDLETLLDREFACE